MPAALLARSVAAFEAPLFGLPFLLAFPLAAARRIATPGSERLVAEFALASMSTAAGARRRLATVTGALNSAAALVAAGLLVRAETGELLATARGDARGLVAGRLTSRGSLDRLALVLLEPIGLLDKVARRVRTSDRRRQGIRPARANRSRRRRELRRRDRPRSFSGSAWQCSRTSRSRPRSRRCTLPSPLSPWRCPPHAPRGPRH